MEVYSLREGWFRVSGNVKHKWRQRNIQKTSGLNEKLCIVNSEVFVTHAVFLIIREATLTPVYISLDNLVLRNIPDQKNMSNVDGS